MHDQVGIAADRRSEMRVLVEGQREMAERVGGVARLLQRTQHQVGDDALFGLARDFFGQALVMLRANGDVDHARQRNGHRLLAASSAPPVPRAAIESLRAGTSMLHFHAPLGKIFNAQRISERLRQRLEFQNFLGIGFFVHAMQRSDAAALRGSARRPDSRSA